MLQGLRTVIYNVDNIERAKEWYTEFVGFPPYFDQPFYVGFNVGGFELGLDPDMSGVTRGTNEVAYWGVADIGSAFAKVVRVGCEVVTQINEVGEGIKVATVKDPFGNVIGLIENPHFEQK
ncbi:MAG TPA: VOC family protein [Pyrinomonadaceae bacterium]|jgi:predicted enzyme related to lactoylglutathione lyase|nr:VOC family protein [Pyrinomonadaceae bacterium]